MKMLVNIIFADIQFSQILLLLIFVVLLGLAVYQLISFWRNDRDNSIRY